MMTRNVSNLYRGGKAFCRLAAAKLRKEFIPWYLFILVTERCNMFCKYCYADIPKRLKDRSRNVKEWSTQDIFKIIDDFYAIGTRYINIQGGEPLLRDDLGDIIDYANGKGMVTDIFTNGLLIHKKLKELKKLSRITISFEGDEETHDKDRGKGTYKRIVENMRLLHENNVKFTINYTVTKNNANMRALKHVLEIARQFDSLVGVGEAIIKLDAGLSERLVRQEQLHKFWQGAKRLKLEGYPLQKTLRSLDVCMDSLHFVTGADSYDEGEPVPYAKKLDPCAFGRYAAYLDTDGMLYPCANLFDKIGRNIFEMGVSEAWKGINRDVKCYVCRDSITGGVSSFFALDSYTVKEAARHFLRIYARSQSERTITKKGDFYG